MGGPCSDSGDGDRQLCHLHPPHQDQWQQAHLDSIRCCSSSQLFCLSLHPGANVSQHIWTAFAAVLLPNCFVSRFILEQMSAKDSQRLFTKFYRWNSVVFFLVMGVASLIFTNCIITLTDISSFNCNNYPFLSYDQELSCPPSSPFKTPIFSFPAHHSWFFLIGNISVVSLSLLHMVFVFVEDRVCGKDYTPVPRV